MSEFLTPEQREQMPVAAAVEDNCVALCEELERIVNSMNVLAAGCALASAVFLGGTLSGTRRRKEALRRPS